jgi:hypothetical protein
MVGIEIKPSISVAGHNVISLDLSNTELLLRNASDFEYSLLQTPNDWGLSATSKWKNDR